MDYTTQHDSDIQSYGEKELSFLKINSKLPAKLHAIYIDFYNRFQNSPIVAGDLSK